MTRTKTSRKSVPARSRRNRRRLINAQDLLRFHYALDPQISPQGDRILFTHKATGDKNNYVTNLWIVDVDDPEARSFTSGGKDSHGRWSPDGRTVAFIRSVDGGKDQVCLLSVDGGEARVLTDFPEGQIREFQWSPDGQTLAVSFRATAPEWTEAAKKDRVERGLTPPPLAVEHPYYREDGDGYFGEARFELFTVDAETGVHEFLYKDPLGDFTFSWSPDGKELALTSNRHRKGFVQPAETLLYRLSVRTKKIKEVPGQLRGVKTDVAWSPDGRYLAYAGRVGEDDVYSPENLHLFVYDIQTRKTRDLLAKDDYCLISIALTDTSAAVFGPTIRWAPRGLSIYLLVGWHGESHIARVSRRGGDVQFLTSGNSTHSLGNLSRDGKRLAALKGNSLRLEDVAVGEILEDEVSLSLLTDLNGPLLSQLQLAKPKSQWVRAADGHRVHVWTMTPPGRLRGKHPGVLEIHGGPHAMYSVGFFHEFQMLAAKGYTVVYANPRGSKGYGEAHCAAIRGSWGDKDWMDIQAVTEFMKSHPRINAKKMGVMGGSYGGYMTNWVIGHTRDFAGAITDRCVSNLVSMAGNSDFPQVPDAYWVGNQWDKPEALWDGSPLKYLGKCRTPTLIIHSEGDLRCNIEQGEQVHAVLMLRGVPVRFVRYPRETSHGMSRGGPPDMRMHRLREIEEWWAKYLS